MDQKTASDQDLISLWIERDPHKPSEDEARIRDHYVHVWAIIGNLPAVHGDLDELARGYEMPEEAVRTAVAYYRKHRTAIDLRLAQNATEPLST